MLVVGTTTVTAGVGAGTGMSKAIYDSLRSSLGITEGPQNHTGLVQLAKIGDALSNAIIPYLKANATITATPTLTVPLGITVSCPPYAGATTAAGTATGTVSSTLT
jgi:hypothetical protein